MNQELVEENRVKPFLNRCKTQHSHESTLMYEILVFYRFKSLGIEIGSDIRS